MENLENILEGLLFVSGDGLDKAYIIEKLGVEKKELDKAIVSLKDKYAGSCGINLIEYKNSIQFTSNSSYAEDISVVLNPIRERALSKATLETVAIIAYKQPITRLDVEEIRGVNSDYAIQQLLQHNMIEVVGRKDAVGKPLLFGTTDEFLKKFELKDISDLPDYEELLSMIDTLEAEDNSLYNNFEIPDEETTLEDASETMLDLVTENIKSVEVKQERHTNKNKSLEELALEESEQESNFAMNYKEDSVNTTTKTSNKLNKDVALEDLPEDFEFITNIPDFLKR